MTVRENAPLVRLDRDPYLHMQSLEVTWIVCLLVIVFVLPIPVGFVAALHVSDEYEYEKIKYGVGLVTFILFIVFRVMYPTLTVEDYN